MNKQLVDQAVHFSIAFILVWLIGPMEFWQACLLGFIAGLIREVTEGGNVVSDGSLLDLLFWTLGGAFAGYTVA